MTPAARERSQVRAPMLFVSAAAWILLVVEQSGRPLVTHCSAEMLGVMPSKASLDVLVLLQFLASIALSWTVMLAAMMAPLMIAPVRHVRDSSFVRRRARAIGLFAAGYSAIWMAAGVVLMTLALAIQLAAHESSVQLASMTFIALVWQSSPAKQRCLNRAHAHTRLDSFGGSADADALRFGLTHGVWCVGSCWALMMLPLQISRGHVSAMAAVALWLFGERLDRPTPPTWCWRGPGKAARIAIAQGRMLLQRI